MDCIDLRGKYGSKYRIKRDEAASKRNTDPWDWMILCKYGEIYPYGGDQLAVMVTGIRIARKMQREFQFLEVVQEGDDMICFKFRVEHLETVAKRVTARRKRQLTDEQLKTVRIRVTTARKFLCKHCIKDSSASENQRSPHEATPGSPGPKILGSGMM